MTIEVARKRSRNVPSYDDLLQPVVYGVMSEQLDDNFSLVDLYSRLFCQWKFIFSIIFTGTLLSIMLALVLPVSYQPALKVSVPTVGNVAVLVTMDKVVGGKNNFPSSQQAVFNNYYNLVRSGDLLVEYVHKTNFLERLYPGSTERKSLLSAGLVKDYKVNIEEPAPERKGGYVASPTRLKVSVEVENEAAGAELLNGFVDFANQRLIANLQYDVHEIIRNKIEVLSRQVAQQRDEYRHDRILTIRKIEHENLKGIAILQEQISAYLAKARANRNTQIANAREAMAMAMSLDISYPTTLDVMAQKGQKGKTVNTAVTVIDNPVTSLYLLGSKYLTTLIETLKNRKNDEGYLVEVNQLREKIHVLENDQTLYALKTRQSDDPWINGLPEKLAELSALKSLNPDFSGLTAFGLDESAAVTNEKLKPKRKLIVISGFVMSLIIALFVSLLVASLNEKKEARDK